MSKSNRSERSALIIPFIFALLITLILSYQFGRDSGLLETEPHEHSNAYTHRTDKDIQSICIAKPTIVDAVECATKQKNQTDYANQEHRADHYLTAQRSMARYAWWMIIVTFGTLLTAAAGIYYLRNTLLETRRLGQFQTRAYLSIAMDKYNILDCCNITAKWSIKNSGQTPARKVRFKQCIVVEPEPFDERFHICEFSETASVFEMGASSERCQEIDTRIKNPETKDIKDSEMSEIFTKERSFWACFYVEYEDVFGVSYYTKSRYRLIMHRGNWEMVTTPNGNEAT